MFLTENILPSCMNELISLMNNPQRRSYNFLRSSQQPAKYSTIIQSNFGNQRGNNASCVALQAATTASKWVPWSLKQLAPVIKVNSNMQRSLTGHSNYCLCICRMHMLHSSYLQVLSFNYNVIN